MHCRSLLIALVLQVAPLAAQAPTQAPGCTAVAVDSARFGTLHVFAACEVERQAKVKRVSKPTAEFPQGVSCLIAEVEFVVDETGTPIASTAVLLSSTTPDFGARVLQRVAQWRYAPAERAGVAVRQLAVGRVAMKSERKAAFVVTRPGEPAPARGLEPRCE